MVFNHIFLKPVDDKDSINSETNQLDIDELEDLSHLGVFKAQYFSAESDLVLEAHDNCFSEDEWQHFLHMLCVKLAFCLSRVNHVGLKLQVPVLNHTDSARLAQLDVFLHQSIQFNAVAVFHFSRDWISSIEVVNVAKSAVGELESEHDPPKVQIRSSKRPVEYELFQTFANRLA